MCGEYTIAPITYISLSEESTKGDLLPMLTITDLIAVISLCATFYSLGYVRGKHDAKTEKDRPTLRKQAVYKTYINQANRHR